LSEPATYDAVLLLSFGGPEGPGDVMPFLENVTAGREVPRERLAEVAEHYLARGGVSPLNAINRALRAAVEQELATNGPALPVYWANRNWQPYVDDVVRQMSDDGVRRAIAFVTSAYASYSGCRQYQDDIARARAFVGNAAPVIDRIRQYFDHPGFIGPFVESTVDALNEMPDGTHLVFTAHSVPEAMAAESGPDGGLYVAQLSAAASLVADQLAATTGVRRPHALVYQSRSGSPAVPWLGPDVGDHLRSLHDGGVPGVVVVPIGFSADHMEVVHDLDTEAAQVAAELGLTFARAATPGTHPSYVAMVGELVRERLGASAPRRALSSLGPAHDRCPGHCCLGRG
jgi:ferrochelatase